MPKNSLKDDHQFDFNPEDYEKVNTSQSLYQDGLDYLKNMGFIVKRNLAGPYAYHDIFMVRNPYACAGINYPNKFKVTLPVHNFDEVATLENAIMSLEDEELRKFWLPIVYPDATQKKPLYTHTAKLIGMDTNYMSINSDIAFDLGVNAYADGTPRAWIPKKEWFSTSVQQLELKDIFTIFPEVERELLALVIGRALVGRNNHLPTGWDEPIRHTSRMAAIILGEDAGLGKSTIFNYLNQAIQKCGYGISTFGKMSSRFNMGDIAASDICYKDDIVKASLKSFFESENTKIMITNGVIRVEEKGINAVDVSSHTTFIVNTNEFDPRCVYSMDPGSADRFKLLSTLREYELNNLKPSGVSTGSPNLRPYHHIDWLADKLEVERNTIMLWAARLCADRFYECITDNSNTHINPLEQRVDTLTHCLRVRLYKDITKQVMSSLALSYVVMKMPSLQVFSKLVSKNKFIQLPSDFLEFNLKEAVAAFYELSANPNLKYILELVLNDYDKSDLHPIHGFTLLDLNSIVISVPKYVDSVYDKEPIQRQLKTLFGNLLLKDGFELSSDSVWLAKAYTSMLPGIESYNKLALKISQAIEDAQTNALNEDKEYDHLSPNWSEEIIEYEKANTSWLAKKFKEKLLEYI